MGCSGGSPCCNERFGFGGPRPKDGPYEDNSCCGCSFPLCHFHNFVRAASETAEVRRGRTLSAWHGRDAGGARDLRKSSRTAIRQLLCAANASGGGFAAGSSLHARHS